MNQNIITTPQRQPQRVQQISDLCLTEDDLHALRRRGTVSCEKRRGSEVFKLRFRTKTGCQRVRYIGNDPNVAEAIRRELQNLQRHCHQLVGLKRQVTEARKLLRQVKRNSEEVIETIGFHYHGFALRKCRRNGRANGSDSQFMD